MQKFNNVSCIIILNIIFLLIILDVRIKIKFSQFQQLQTKSGGNWIWKVFIFVCLIQTLALYGKRIYTQEDITYKRASQKEYEY